MWSRISASTSAAALGRTSLNRGKYSAIILQSPSSSGNLHRIQGAALISEELQIDHTLKLGVKVYTCLSAHRYFFHQHQHELRYRADTSHLQLHHALCFPFCFSIFARNEHFLIESTGSETIHHL